MITQGLHEVKGVLVSNHYKMHRAGGWNRTITVIFKDGSTLELEMFGDDYGNLIFEFEEMEEDNA